MSAIFSVPSNEAFLFIVTRIGPFFSSRVRHLFWALDLSDASLLPAMM